MLIAFGIGLPLTLWIAPKHNSLGRLGLSYILGLGLFTLIIYEANLLGLKLAPGNTALLFLVFSILLLLFQRENIRCYKEEISLFFRRSRMSFVEKALFLGSAFFVVSSFVNTLFWPVYIWDALTLYDFRAHVFIQAGFIKSALAALGNEYYLAYPLLTSLLHTIVYLFDGNNPQFVYSLFYLSLGLVFFGLLCEYVSQKLSLLFTFMLLSIPQIFNQSVVSYTNLPFLTYFSLGAIYYFISDSKRTPGYLILSAILVGLSTWTRFAEPFWLAVFGIVIIMALYRRRILDIITFAILFFPIRQVWINLKVLVVPQVTTLNEFISAATVSTNIFNFGRWLEVIVFLYNSVFLNWGPVFILFLVASAYAVITKKMKKNVFLMYLITYSLLATFIFGTFFYSFSTPSWSQIPDSASRTAMIFYPLFLCTVALTIFLDYKDKL